MLVVSVDLVKVEALVGWELLLELLLFLGDLTILGLGVDGGDVDARANLG